MATRNYMLIETDTTKAAAFVIDPSPPDLTKKEDEKDRENSNDSSEQECH